MTACPTLVTERLVLRPFVESDLDAYTAVMSAPAVRGSLHLPDAYGPAEAWAAMAGWRGQWELRGTGQWALVLRATGALIGRAGLHHPERGDWPGVEVGWALHPDHWGHGYATEAGRRSLDYAFDVVGVDEIYSVILPANTASEAVARRLGLRPTGSPVVLSHSDLPHRLWRVHRSDWWAGRRPAAPISAG